MKKNLNLLNAYAQLYRDQLARRDFKGAKHTLHVIQENLVLMGFTLNEASRFFKEKILESRSA